MLTIFMVVFPIVMAVFTIVMVVFTILERSTNARHPQGHGGRGHQLKRCVAHCRRTRAGRPGRCDCVDLGVSLPWSLLSTKNNPDISWWLDSNDSTRINGSADRLCRDFLLFPRAPPCTRDARQCMPFSTYIFSFLVPHALGMHAFLNPRSTKRSRDRSNRIDKTIEFETTDRVDTALPGLQSAFAQQVFVVCLSLFFFEIIRLSRCHRCQIPILHRKTRVSADHPLS
jgi:hypothetical protein